MPFDMASFHVVLLACATLNGACVEHARLGPYLGQVVNGQIASCGMQSQEAINESPAVLKWFVNVDRKTYDIKWVCDSAKIARL